MYWEEGVILQCFFREEKKKKKKGWLLFLEVLAAKLLSGRLCSAEQHTVLGTAKKSFLTEQNVMIKPGFIRIPTPFMEKIAKFWTNCILFIIFFVASICLWVEKY